MNSRAQAAFFAAAVVLIAGCADGVTSGGGKEIRAEFPIRVAQFSPDGKLLALGTSKGTIEVWDLHAKSKLRSWTAHKGGIQSLAFDPRGEVLASEGYDRHVRLWNVKSAREIWAAPDPRGTNELADADGQNTRIAFTEDGNRLAAFGFFWDTKAGKQLDRYGASGPVCIRAGLLASKAKDGLHVLDTVDMSKVLDISEDAIPRVEISPDGKLIAVGVSLYGGGARMRQLPSGKKVVAPPFMGRAWVFGVAFSPDSKHLAFSGQKKEILVIDTQTLQPTITLPTPGVENYWVGFSPDGKTLAAVGVNEKVRLWSFPEGKPLSK